MPLLEEGRKITAEKTLKMSMKRRHLNKKRQAKNHRTPLRSKVLKTAKDYTTQSTIHGCGYLANEEHPLTARFFWMLVMTLGILFATWQITTLYHQWQNNPVVTTMDRNPLPIEDVDFPGVTICPQGLIKDILDSVLSKQLEEYIIKKTIQGQAGNAQRSLSAEESLMLKQTHKIFWNMTSEDMDFHVAGFLNETYPGALDKPTSMIPMMVAERPDTILQNEAVLQLDDEEECNQTENAAIWNEGLSQEYICPTGFEEISGNCLHDSKRPVTYNEAIGYCSSNNGAEILHVDTYEELNKIDIQKITGILIFSRRH